MLRARLLRKSFKHAVPPQSKFILTSRARLVDGHINTTVADGGNYARSLATSSSTTTTNTDSTFLKSQASHGYKFSNRLHASRFLWTCLVSLGLLAAYTASKPSLLAEEAQDKPAFTKDQVGIVCIIGGPAAGKSTQVDNASKRFNLTKIDAKKDMKKHLEDVISNSDSKRGKKPRVVIEGFPSTLEQADKFQKDICPILLIIFIDLEDKTEKAISRIQGNDESLRRDARINWKRFQDKSTGLIKQFRFQGNILEITGEWPMDEVWEQVEAKLESALELDDRGEL